MINVNFGRNQTLLEACRPLQEYAWFVDKVRSKQESIENLEEAIDAALDGMPDDFILKPFLIANKAEVKRMSITEYDEARTFAELREESYEQGVEKGFEKGIEKGIEKGVLKTLIGLVTKGTLTISQAAEEADMTVAEFKAATGLN